MRYWMIALLLAITALGARDLNSDTIWFDEWWSIFNAGGITYEDSMPETPPLNLLEVWRRVERIDPIHPPGYAFAIAVWGRFLGWSAFSGRLLSLFLGLLSTAAIYRLGDDLQSTAAGLWSATLFGTLAFYTHYYHELRMYTLLTLLVTALLWSYWRLVFRRGPVAFASITFVVSAAGLVYVQYLSSFILIGLGIYHLIFAPKNRRWLGVAALAVVSGILYTPWMEVVWRLYQEASANPARDGAYTNATVLWQSALVLSNRLIPLLLLLLGLAAVIRWRAKRLILTVCGVGALLLLLINWQTGMFIHIRYVLILWPPLAIVFGVTLAWLGQKNRLLSPVVVLLWIAVGFWNYRMFEATYNRGPESALAWRELSEVAQADIPILFLTPTNTLAWYHERSAAYYLQSQDIMLHPQTIQDTFDDIPDDMPQIWGVHDPSLPAARQDAFETYLRSHYQACEVVHESARLYIQRYSSPGTC